MRDNLEITKTRENGVVILNLSGRIDAYWSDHLKDSIDEELNEGHYTIALDMSAVFFISSAGIRVLLSSYKKLKTLNGAFFVKACSDEVYSILKMTGLEVLLSQREAPQEVAREKAKGRVLSTKRFSFEIEALDDNREMTCNYIGNPDLLVTGSFSASHLKTEKISGTKLGVGLGAIGGDFLDCRKRFGEFIAVSGTLAYQPTDNKDKIDYSLPAGSFLPEVKMLYGLICEGAFSHLVNFYTSAPHRSTRLSDLVEKTMGALNFKAAALAFVCETTGLVGASLSRSPLDIPPESVFLFPDVRENIRFTPEKAFPKTLALVAGVAVKENSGLDKTFLKPLGADSGLYGHFHCAVFPFHPLKKDAKEISEVVHRLYESEDALAILHLINDDRDVVGAGESEFARGLCWISEIKDFNYIL